MTIDEALQAAQSGNVREAEEAWLEIAEDTSAPIEKWTDVLELVVKQTKNDSPEALAWSAIDTLCARLEARAAIRHSAKFLRFFSKNEEFRNRAAEMYEQAYADIEGLSTLMEISGLRGGKPIRRAMQTLEICLCIEEGSFLAHKDDGPPAKVINIDRDTWTVRLETPSGEEICDPVSLGDEYEYAEPHDFRVLSRFDPDAFAAKLKSEPADIVLTILQAHDNRMTSDQLESMLCPRHIAHDDWAKWWTKLRATLRKISRVRLEGRNPVMITYEQHEVSLEEAAWEKFNPKLSPKSWHDTVAEYMRECRDRKEEPNDELLGKLADAVAVEAAALEKTRDTYALGAWLVVGEINRLRGLPQDDTAVMRIIGQSDTIREALDDLEADVFIGLALRVIRHSRPEEWPQDFAAVLPGLNPARCDEVVANLVDAGHGELLKDIPQTILADPIANINGLCWLYQGPKNVTQFEVPPLVTLLTRIFSVLDQTDRLDPEVGREARTRIRATLTARKMARFNDCLGTIDAGMADALRTQIQRSNRLTDAITNEMMGHIRRQFADELFVKQRIEPWEDLELLFCTPPGKLRREMELAELMNVKMKENAKAIGEAAERGDLSENSEYKFALEERDLLRARAAEIQGQLNKAQLIDPSEISTETVGIGTRVSLRNTADQRTVTLTFLGPWEADIENGVLNYQAPLSQSMMGQPLGAQIELDLADHQGKYEIQEITKGID